MFLQAGKSERLSMDGENAGMGSGIYRRGHWSNFNEILRCA